MPQLKRVCVIGAGPSGMSVLYHFNKLKTQGKEFQKLCALTNNLTGVDSGNTPGRLVSIFVFQFSCLNHSFILLYLVLNSKNNEVSVIQTQGKT